MTPDVVVDVGNTRASYAVVFRGKVGLDSSTTDMESASKYFDKLHWGGRRHIEWLIAGVNPKLQAEVVAVARRRGDNVTEVTSYLQLPIKVDVDFPEKVGLDRLLGAVAANRLKTPGRSVLTVDVGTAMTINFIDPDGTFVGGLIAPGPRLMTTILYEGTAKLPEVDMGWHPYLNETYPAKTTEDAIRTGVRFALSGAVNTAVMRVRASGYDPEVFITGGNSGFIFHSLLPDIQPRGEPNLNLQGLLITAETLP